MSEAGLVREEAGGHVLPGPAPPSGPHLGGSGTAAPDPDPRRQAELGVRQAGPGLLCVLWWGTQEAEGSGVPLETCL